MDPVTINILESTMVSICREMGIVLMKTAYSTIFSEALDFTCGLAEMNGDLMAVADYCPSQIGGMPLLVKSCLQEIPVSEIEEGDVILHNDPYRGGLHTPEHTFFKPVFVAGSLSGFAAGLRHALGVGGRRAGCGGEAREVFHEGLRVPPVKIKRAGKDVDDIWRLLLANVRTPRYNYGDFRALIAAIDLGERRMADLARKHGVAAFHENVTALMDYSERRMRAEIEKIPDGCYVFEDCMEDDGIEDKVYTIRAEVTVDGSDLIADS